MRILLLIAVGLLGLSVVPAPAQEAGVEYGIDIDQSAVFSTIKEKDGKRARYVSLHFQIKSHKDRTIVTSVPKEEIIVEEDGVKVANLEILQPRGQKLTVVMVLDIS